MKHYLQNICYIFVILATLSSPATMLAVGYTPPPAKIPPQTKAALLSNLATQLLTIQKWSSFYEMQRKKDINYLLGSIKDESLAQLTAAQKEQVIGKLRSLAIDQLIKDQGYFKNYLVGQYSKFFTNDEMHKLIEYYQTHVMQMVIDTKLAHQELTIKQISDSLAKQTTAEKEITKWYIGSYLDLRYKRFLDNVDPKVNKMIFERTKQVLEAVFKEIPNIIKALG